MDSSLICQAQRSWLLSYCLFVHLQPDHVCPVQGQRFVFDRDTVHYDLAAGSILMSGVWQGDGQRYSLTMQPAGGAAVVTAAHQPHPQVRCMTPQRHKFLWSFGLPC